MMSNKLCGQLTQRKRQKSTQKNLFTMWEISSRYVRYFNLYFKTTNSTAHAY